MSLLIGNENDASKLLSVSQHLLHYRGLSFDKAIENKRHWISSNEPNLSFFGSMSAIKIPSLAFMKKIFWNQSTKFPFSSQDKIRRSRLLIGPLKLRKLIIQPIYIYSVIPLSNKFFPSVFLPHLMYARKSNLPSSELFRVITKIFRSKISTFEVLPFHNKKFQIYWKQQSSENFCKKSGFHQVSTFMHTKTYIKTCITKVFS